MCWAPVKVTKMTLQSWLVIRTVVIKDNLVLGFYLRISSVSFDASHWRRGFLFSGNCTFRVGGPQVLSLLL